MAGLPVIAVIDVGKTNKKLFLFDKEYRIVHEQSARFTETTDEDGDPCENLESLRASVFDSLRTVVNNKDFAVQALNFSAYGASFVYIDQQGNPLTPLYNYLKPYPEALKQKFYSDYGGEESFSICTASPVLGSLNSGMQLYRIKQERPGLFARIRHALHLPQYLSWLVSGNACSDMTSIGCHTNLWDFVKKDYHEWVYAEGLAGVLPPVLPCDTVTPAQFEGTGFLCGIGLHDSSAALIPYLLNFREPFVLISSGTWCISLNPFNDAPLTREELNRDCLCYLDFKGHPVKASRLFAGRIHDEQVKQIAAHFHTNPARYRAMPFNAAWVSSVHTGNAEPGQTDWTQFDSDEEAYHRLMQELVAQQKASTQLVLKDSPVKRIFIDGGFSDNTIYMNLLAAAFPDMEVYAATMPQATSLGAALAIHEAWNAGPYPGDIIALRHYAVPSYLV